MDLIFDTATTTLGIIMGIATALAVFLLFAVIAIVILGLVTMLISWVNKQIKGGK